MPSHSENVLSVSDDAVEDRYLQFKEKGYTLFTQADLPFTEEEWSVLEKECNSLDYFAVQETEVTKEDVANVHCFRIKVKSQPEIHNEAIWGLLNKPEMYVLYKDAIGLNEPFIDRMQAHVYNPNGLLGRHCDADAVPSYRCSAILMMNDDYAGGEFVLFKDEENPVYFKPAARSLILTDSLLDHQVDLIHSGFRKSLCFFFSEGPIKPDNA